MNPHIIQELINIGSPLDVSDQAGKTPLWYAVDGHNEANARILLEAGADPSIADHTHQTPLMLAQTRDLNLLVKLLGGSREKGTWISFLLKSIQSGRMLEVEGETFRFVSSASKEKNYYAHQTPFYSKYMNNCYRLESWIEERIAYLLWHKTEHILAYIYALCQDFQMPFPSMQSLKEEFIQQVPHLHQRVILDIETCRLPDILVKGLYAGARFVATDRSGSTSWYAENNQIFRKDITAYERSTNQQLSEDTVKRVFNSWTIQDGLAHTSSGVFGLTLFIALSAMGFPTLRTYMLAQSRSDSS